MENKLVHMHTVSDALARYGWKVIDIGLVTARESSYGNYLQPGKDVMAMSEDYTVRNIPYTEVMCYVNSVNKNS